MNKRQKYIKRKYFKAVSGDPFYYIPIWDESLHLSPRSLIMIIDLIIKILQDPDALFLVNFVEYIDPEEIKNTITRNGPDETDEEFRKRVLERTKKVK